MQAQEPPTSHAPVKPSQAPPPPPAAGAGAADDTSGSAGGNFFQSMKQTMATAMSQNKNDGPRNNDAEQGGGTDFSAMHDQSNAPSNQFGTTFPVGSITGIRIKVHWMLPGVMILASIFGAARDGSSGFAAEIFLYGPILFGAVLVHELCHCWMAKRCGGEVVEILLWPLGGLAFIGKLNTAANDLRVAAAGPLSHIPQIFLFMILTACVNHGNVTANSVPGRPSKGFWSFLFFHSMMLHVSLFAFNLLLPCYPLDGGRILADALLMRRFQAQAAAKIVVAVSVPIAALLLIGGVLLFIQGNATAVLTICVALWMGSQIRSLWQMVRDDTVEAHPLFANAQQWEANTPELTPGTDPNLNANPVVSAV